MVVDTGVSSVPLLADGLIDPMGVDSCCACRNAEPHMGRIWRLIDRGIHGYERIGAVIATTLFITAPIALAIYWLRHHVVAAWVPVAVGVPLLALAVIALFVGASRPGRSSGRTRRERDLERQLERAEEAREVAVTAAVAEYRKLVARSEYEKQLITEALESVQQAVGAEEEWDLDDLVERGVLGPARGLLVRHDEEDVRLAVLVPTDERHTDFAMRWAAGHRPESVRNYRRPIDQTLAGIAFRRGEYVDRSNVREDRDFVQNPRESRRFAALVAVPLRVEERIVGVLSVVSTIPNAFREPDKSFIKAVGALLDVVLAYEHDALRWNELDEPDGEEEHP
jgi:hypothetical protein